MNKQDARYVVTRMDTIAGILRASVRPFVDNISEKHPTAALMAEEILSVRNRYPQMTLVRLFAQYVRMGPDEDGFLNLDILSRLLGLEGQVGFA